MIQSIYSMMKSICRDVCICPQQREASGINPVTFPGRDLHFPSVSGGLLAGPAKVLQGEQSSQRVATLSLSGARKHSQIKFLHRWEPLCLISEDAVNTSVGVSVCVDACGVFECAWGFFFVYMTHKL